MSHPIHFQLTESSSQKDPTADAGRRKFIKSSAALLATGSGLGSTLSSKGVLAGLLVNTRSLSLHNAHTGETYKGVYWENGSYHDKQILKISHLFRDHRENETMLIDTAVIDILWGVAEQVEKNMQFSIISGYRTRKTNEMLRRKSSRVAKFSLHMVGKAVDVRAPDNKMQAMRKAGLKLAAGGVGYYPGAGFIHFDSGEVRDW